MNLRFGNNMKYDIRLSSQHMGPVGYFAESLFQSQKPLKLCYIQLDGILWYLEDAKMGNFLRLPNWRQISKKT